MKLAVILWRSICGYIPGTRYVSKMVTYQLPGMYLKKLRTRYQISKINTGYHGIVRIYFGFGLGGIGLV